MMDLCAITCTGDRPEAFGLCERWMARQTLKPVRWIVVDDGATPTICTMGQTYIRRERKAGEPRHTLVPNMIAAMPYVVGDALIVWEDDDWYRDTYCERMAHELDGVDIAGETNAVYCNVYARKIMEHRNQEHASLCSTALRTTRLDRLAMALELPDPFVDLRLWRMPLLKKNLFSADPHISVGIKGMPGRHGIGMGHDASWSAYCPDHRLEILREIIGYDVDCYRPFAAV